MSSNQSSLWMHSNLQLLFWDKRRVTGKAKKISPLPPPGTYSPWPKDVRSDLVVLLRLLNLFIYHCFGPLIGFYQFEVYIYLEFRSAPIVVLMKGTWPLTVGIWWVVLKVLFFFCSLPHLIGIAIILSNYFFSLQTCGSCGNELSKCPICCKRIKIRIPLWIWVVHTSPIKELEFKLKNNIYGHFG